MRVLDTAGLAMLVAGSSSPYRYEVSALADPGVLPRLLELVAKRGLVPTEMSARRHGGADGEERLTVTVGVDGVEPMAADHIAQCMTQVAGVEAVTFRRQARSAAA